MVSIRDTDARALAEELQTMEAAADDPVGGSAKGHGKREDPLQDPQPASGGKVHPIDT